MGIECRALMTKMSAPIGNYVGNSLEILESINCLKGEGPSDLQILVELIGILTHILYYIIQKQYDAHVFIVVCRNNINYKLLIYYKYKL